MATYSAKDIAFIFVQRGIDEGKPITQMKLQKMIYFAHGWHLADNNGEPLVSEKFEAWKFGPVIPYLYDIFRLYGKFPIVDPFWLKITCGYDLPEKLDKNANDTIESTWNLLKDIDAIQLSNWTHRDDSPWHEA